MRAEMRVRKYMALHMPHKTIKGVCGYAPYSVTGGDATPYAVILSRGEVACPMVEFAGEKAYQELKEKYRAKIMARGYRGYFVSVDKVERLNV